MAAEATERYVALVNGADASSIPIPTSTSTSKENPKKETTKKEKKIKDPNAPKRPASAYLIFQNKIREKVKAENPDSTYQEIVSKIADIWKEMGEEEKKVSCGGEIEDWEIRDLRRLERGG